MAKKVDHLSKVDNDIKITEKLKFWEEQDQINKELIPRVVKNHEMITDLTYQFEKNLATIALLQSKLDQFQEEINSLKQLNSQIGLKVNSLYNEITETEELKSIVYEKGKQIQDIQLELAKFQEELKSVKSESVVGQNIKNLVIYIGVLGAIILSIIGIIL